MCLVIIYLNIQYTYNAFVGRFVARRSFKNNNNNNNVRLDAAKQRRICTDIDKQDNTRTYCVVHKFRALVAELLFSLT